MATEDDVVGTMRCECGAVFTLREGQDPADLVLELEAHLHEHATPATPADR